MDFNNTVVFPQAKDMKEQDLFNTLDTVFNNLGGILNRGIRFQDNVDCTLVSFTSNGVADTETTVAHTLGKVPTGVIVYEQDKAGSLYKSKAYDASNIYIKSDVASVAFKVIVF